MAWNEPGGGSKDPWSGKGGDQGPPELDEVVRKLQEKLGGLFGGKGGSGSSGDGSGGGGPWGISKLGGRGIGIVGLVVLVIWVASGIYIVEPAERGVVMRFGAFTEVTSSGPHWHLPYPIEDVITVNVDQITSFPHKAQMLTRDENIVDVELTVQSRIQDPADFLFQDQSPEKTLRDATETAVREVIGKSKLDFILTEGRGAVADQIKDIVQSLVNQYRTGIEVVNVNMLPAKPPEQVKSAFDDAIKAREDKERVENQAEAYSNEVLPKARGAAARRVADAQAYRDKVTAEAQGETSRFLAVLAQYLKAPEVTRRRLYLDAVEDVLANSNNVVVDVKGGNNLMYLPLDKLINQRASENSSSATGMSRPMSVQEPPATPLRDVARGRRTR